MVNKRLLVIGWDAADWRLLHPLLDAGKLPNLLRLVESGTSGALMGTAPPLEPVAWTTLATGRFAEHHGVLGGLELRPDGGGVRPIGRRSWRAPAFWELLSTAGFATAVINWPATSPATGWPGIVVDERFATPIAKDFESWPLAPHVVSPALWREVMTDLRIHPREIGMDDLAALEPRASEIDQKHDRRLARLAISLARTASVHAAATHLAEAAAWDVLAVRYTLLCDATNDIAQKPDPDGFYGAVPEAVCRFYDLMLARLLALAGPETTLLLVAPYTRAEAAAPSSSLAHEDLTAERRRGIMVAAGPGIAPDTILQGATVFDLCPTVLSFFGLTAESDGRALQGILPEPVTALKFIAIPKPISVEDSDPAAHLFDLGYADRIGAEEESAIAQAAIVAQTNLADSLLARGEWRKAADAFEAVLLRRPDDYGASVNLCHALLQLRDVAAARPVAETVLAMASESPLGDLLMGVVLALEGDEALAGEHLRRARQSGSRMLDVLLRIGWVELLLHRPGEAEAVFRDAIANEDAVAEAHTGLGISLEEQDRFADAEQALRRAIALEFHNPLAHRHLGQVLAKQGASLDAVKAMRIALAQQPESAEVQALLTRLERGLAANMAAQALAEHDESRRR